MRLTFASDYFRGLTFGLSIAIRTNVDFFSCIFFRCVEVLRYVVCVCQFWVTSDHVVKFLGTGC